MVPIEDNEARKSSFNFTSLIFNFLIDLIDVIVSILLGTTQMHIEDSFGCVICSAGNF